MNASIPIPFALGQELWWVGNGHHEKRIECPDCFGKLAVTLTLGNGEQLSLQCAGCALGFGNPLGTVPMHVYELSPQPFVAKRVWMSGDDIYYSESEPSATCYSSVNAKDLFSTRDECAQECAKRNVKYTEESEKQAIRQATRNRDKYAWSAHYWRSEVRRQENDLARAKARLAACSKKTANAP